MKNISYRVTIEINAPIAVVWEALIKPEIISQYYFNVKVNTNWQVGTAITFWDKDHEEKGTILEFNPEKTLRYNLWSPASGIEDKPENYMAVAFSLTETKQLTILTVMLENIPDENKRAQLEMKWKKILAGMKSLLEKQAEPAY